MEPSWKSWSQLSKQGPMYSAIPLRLGILSPDAERPGSPRWGQLVQIMRFLVKWVVAQNRLGQMNIDIKNGRLTAIGNPETIS